MPMQSRTEDEGKTGASDEPIASQICRLLDAIDNQYDPLKLVEPLVDAANVRYGELRQTGFSTARHRMRVEAVEALMARGGNLPPRPVFEDDGGQT